MVVTSAVKAFGNLIGEELFLLAKNLVKNALKSTCRVPLILKLVLKEEIASNSRQRTRQNLVDKISSQHGFSAARIGRNPEQAGGFLLIPFLEVLVTREPLACPFKAIRISLFSVLIRRGTELP